MKYLYFAGSFAWAGLAVAKVGELLSFWTDIHLTLSVPFAFAVCAVWQFNLAVHE